MEVEEEQRQNPFQPVGRAPHLKHCFRRPDGSAIFPGSLFMGAVAILSTYIKLLYFPASEEAPREF